MKFMVIRKADAETEAGVMPSKELIDQMTDYNEKAVTAGIMLDGNGLMSSAHGARVSFKGGKPTVVDGPFAEAKELIAGYSIVDLPSLEAVIEEVKKWPPLDGHGNVQIEIRRVFTAEDLGFSDEQLDREARLRQMSQQQQ
ncbi:MAG: YciI family protein [Devosia sp.]